jgi:hypothetical protein
LLAEDGEEQLIGKLGLDGVPIDVEEVGIGRIRAVFEHVVPPGVLRARGHVVGDHIKNVPHAMLVERGDKFAISRLTTQLRIDLVVIAQIVAMGAVSFGPQIRRAIDMADAQLVQIGNDCGGVAKRELAVKLQAVGRQWARLALRNLLDHLQGDREWSGRRDEGGRHGRGF